MSVVQLNGNLVRKTVEISPVMFLGPEFARLVTTNDVLQRRCAHEVLLLQPKFLTLEKVVVGVQNPGNIFREVSVEHGLNIISVVD